MDIGNIEGIVFDKDGTLFEFARTWEAWANAFLSSVSNDPDHAQRLGAAIGFDTRRQQFAHDSIAIAGTPREVAQALAPELPEMSITGLIETINGEAAMAPQAEAVPLLAFLSALNAQGYALGVATNDAEAPARAHLDRAHVLEQFAFIAGFDSGHGAKPGPGQLKAFCAHTGLDAAQCVMVGDSTHDLMAGRSAGFKVVGVLTGMAVASELEPFADAVLSNIGELPDWLAAQE